MSEKRPVPQRQEFRFAHRLRVRWAEVDMQKIVFNAHYLMYFDTAVADYWRRLLMPYAEAMHALGGDLYVKKASLTYHASAEYDDLLDVGMRCIKLGNSSMVFEGAVFQGAKCLVSGELLYVYANPKTQTSLPIPELLRNWLQGFEAGEPMATVSFEPWATCEADVGALRYRVFHEEYGIDPSILSDQSDVTATHAVVRNKMGQVVAAGRLLQKADGWVVGRMQVLRPLRGTELGRLVLRALEEQAASRGASHVALAAMLSAEPFYVRQGYARIGEPYDLVGVSHVDMKKKLANLLESAR